MDMVIDVNRHRNIEVLAGRIVGYEYKGKDEEFLLVTINVSPTSSVKDFRDVPFRDKQKDSILKFTQIGDHLMVVARYQDRPIRGKIERRYIPVRYYAASTNRKRVVTQANPPESSASRQVHWGRSSGGYGGNSLVEMENDPGLDAGSFMASASQESNFGSRMSSGTGDIGSTASWTG